MYADLVEQQTTTSGTGAYVVSGSALGRRTFAQAYPSDTAYIPYVVTDDAGNFECCVGSWTVSTNTLTRGRIYASSNGAVSPLNWAPGVTKRIYVSLFAGMVELLAVRHNWAAGSYPSATDDASAGYQPGSLWREATGSYVFICQDATAGAAVWHRLPIPTDHTWSVGVTVEQISFSGTILDPDANLPFSPTGQTHNGYNDGGNNRYGDGGFTVHGAFTSNATPTKMAYKGNHATYSGIYCEGPSCVTIIGSVSCIDGATGDIKSWKVEAVAKTNSSGDTTIVAGASPSTLYSGDAGLNTASIAVVGSTAGFDCAIEVTGIAAKNLTWSATLNISSSADY